MRIPLPIHLIFFSFLFSFSTSNKTPKNLKQTSSPISQHSSLSKKPLRSLSSCSSSPGGSIKITLTQKNVDPELDEFYYIFEKDSTFFDKLSCALINGIAVTDLSNGLRISTQQIDGQVIEFGFSEALSTIKNMFYKHKNVAIIDMSQFNSKSLTNMAYAFVYCTSLTSINLRNVDTSNVTNMEYMFGGCSSLTYLDLSNFDTSKVKSFYGMFGKCSNLVSLDLSNFNTGRLKNTLREMFPNCSKLRYLNLCSFVVTNETLIMEKFITGVNPEVIVTFKSSKFPQLLQLLNSTQMNIKEDDFDCKCNEGCNPKCSIYTENNNMHCNSCSSRYYYYTLSGVSNCYFCYSSCSSCSNYYTVEDGEEQHNCISCKDGYYFLESSHNCYNSLTAGLLFFNTADNLYHKCFSSCKKCFGLLDDSDPLNPIHNCEICADNYYFLSGTSNCYSEMGEGYYFDEESSKFFQCYDNCKTCNEGYKDGNQNCESCKDEYKFVKGTTNCINGQEGYYYDNGIDKYDKCHERCKTCSEKSVEGNQKCDSCKIGYYFMYGESSKNCYQENEISDYYLDITDKLLYKLEDREGYYYDSSSKKFKPCFSSCKTCITLGDETDSKCTECVSDYTLLGTNCIIYSSSTNTSDTNPKPSNTTENDNRNCTYNYYIDSSGNKICLSLDESCPPSMPFIRKNSRECISCGISEMRQGLCGFSDNEELSQSSLADIVTAADTVILNQEIISNVIESNEQIVIKGKELTLSISTTDIDKAEENKKERATSSTIELGQCEQKLREAYNIPNSVPLILRKIDIKRKDAVSCQVEYSVYRADDTSTKLELSVCEGTKITINSPLTIDSGTEKMLLNGRNQGYDFLDANDDFYNDLCTPYDSENGTDITIRERKSDIYMNNTGACEEGCEYGGWNEDRMTAQCKCNIKTEVNTDVKKTSFGEQLKDSFFDFDTIFNVKVLKCMKKVFSLEGYRRNYMCFVTLGLSVCFAGLMAYYMIFGNKLKYELICISEDINKIHTIISEHKNEKNNQINKDDSNIINTEKEKDLKKNNNEKMIESDIKSISGNINKKENSESKQNIDLLGNSSLDIIEPNNELNIKKIKNTNKKVHILDSKKHNIRQNLILLEDNHNEDTKNSIDWKPFMRNRKSNIDISRNNTRNLTSLTSNELNITTNNEQGSLKNLKAGKIIGNQDISSENKEKGKNVDPTILPNNNSLDENKLKDTSNNNKNPNECYSSDHFFQGIISFFPPLERSSFFVDYEIDSLNFEFALEIDHRPFWRYYWSLLKKSHNIPFTFIAAEDDNSSIVKTSMLILSYSLNIGVTCLFFTDDTVEKINSDNGFYNFLFQLPITIYSKFICDVFITLFYMLSLSQDHIAEFKDKLRCRKMDKKEIAENIDNKYKFMMKRYYWFIGIGFSLNTILWLYLTCFGIVYKNTQKHLLLNIGNSILQTFIYPLVLNLIPYFTRIFSLKFPKLKYSKYVYVISQKLDSIVFYLLSY